MKKEDVESFLLNEDRWKLAVLATGLGTYDWNPQTDKIYWDEALHEIFELSLNSKIDRNEHFYFSLHPDDKEAAIQEFETFLDAKSEKKSFSVNYRIILKKKKVKHIESNGLIFRNSKGEAVRVIGTCLDVTERKEAEEAILESELKFRSIVHDQTEMIVRWLPGGIRTFVNNAYCTQFKLTKEEALGNSFFSLINPEDLNRVKRRIKEITIENPIITGSHKVVLSNGEIGWHEWTDRGFFDENGEIVEYQSVGRDITDKIIAQERLTADFQEVNALKKQLENENYYLREEISSDKSYEQIIHSSERFQRVLTEVDQVAQTDSTVLLTGETGTGKELISRAIHELSNRSDRPLVNVNCATLPKDLIESELFGHEKGAFTGASEKKIGKFELANKSTIFLDEIGELPIDLQAKLLRVLQEGKFERVGGNQEIEVDARIISATNRDLLKEIEKGNFRSDLYYRLNVFPINLPPLRERIEDIPLLLDHFVEKYARKMGKNIQRIPKDAMKKLTSYDWPGNIREMENLIERAVILSKDGVLHLGEINQSAKESVEIKKILSLDDVERAHILKVLKTLSWKISGKNGAAEALDLKPSTLRDRMKKLDIKRPNSKE